MTWRVLGTLAAALAIVGVAVALLAPNHGNAIDPVANAAQTTAQAGSAEFGLAGSVTAAGQTIPLKGNGVIDLKNQRARMNFAMTMPGLGEMDIEELMNGTTMYMRFPAQLAQRLPGGKQWVKVDLQALGKASGVDMKQLMQAGQNNPTDVLEALRAVGSSRKVGDENIGGAPTTHYAATIDLAKAASTIPDKQQQESVKQLFASSGLQSIPVDVWVDRSGRVRRESVKFSAGGNALDMTMDFTRFGVPVDTTPPPDDQVMDMSALLGAAGAGSG